MHWTYRPRREFYVLLTGWTKEISSEEWAALGTPEGVFLVYQTVDGYIPPKWPCKDGEQQLYRGTASKS